MLDFNEDAKLTFALSVRSIKTPIDLGCFHFHNSCPLMKAVVQFSARIHKITESPHLVLISLLRISLLRFFKKILKYLPYANFGLFISLVRFFGQNIWLMRFLGYLFHYCDLPYANFWLFISLLQIFG